MFSTRTTRHPVAVLGWVYQRLRLNALLRRGGIHDRLPPRVQALEGLLPHVALRDLRVACRR